MLPTCKPKPLAHKNHKKYLQWNLKLWALKCGLCGSIDERRQQVLARRQALKASANKRRAALTAAKTFQEFAADVDDLNTWLHDKMKTAGDESYRDLTNIERKLQKHEAFERELRANEGQLRAVNKVKDKKDGMIFTVVLFEILLLQSWRFITTEFYYFIQPK